MAFGKSLELKEIKIPVKYVVKHEGLNRRQRRAEAALNRRYRLRYYWDKDGKPKSKWIKVYKRKCKGCFGKPREVIDA